MLYRPYPVAAFGADDGTVPVITTCPHCSKLVNGSCLVCADGDPHPSCSNCVGGKHSPPRRAWYKSQMVVSASTVVLASVVSTLFLRYVIDKLVPPTK